MWNSCKDCKLPKRIKPIIIINLKTCYIYFKGYISIFFIGWWRYTIYFINIKLTTQKNLQIIYKTEVYQIAKIEEYSKHLQNIKLLQKYIIVNSSSVLMICYYLLYLPFTIIQQCNQKIYNVKLSWRLLMTDDN